MHDSGPLPHTSGGGLGRGQTAGGSQYDFEYGGELMENGVVLKANHLDAPADKERGSTKVILFGGGVEALTVVELHGQPPRGAVEIQDVGAAGVLPSELQAIEPFCTELRPEQNLSVRAVSAQDATAKKRAVHL